MALRFMLDTDICIYALGSRREGLVERLEGAAGEICMSSITFAALMLGVEKSQRLRTNLARLHGFKALVPVQDFGEQAAIHYGSARAQLEQSGTPIGANDMLIGAHARSLGLTLVTNNRREFDRIPGLKVENWAA